MCKSLNWATTQNVNLARSRTSRCNSLASLSFHGFVLGSSDGIILPTSEMHMVILWYRLTRAISASIMDLLHSASFLHCAQLFADYGFSSSGKTIFLPFCTLIPNDDLFLNTFESPMILLKNIQAQQSDMASQLFFSEFLFSWSHWLTLLLGVDRRINFNRLRHAFADQFRSRGVVC